jgi:hypothetical protein
VKFVSREPKRISKAGIVIFDMLWTRVDSSVSRAAGSGFYYILQKLEPVRAWILGKAHRPGPKPEDNFTT